MILNTGLFLLYRFFILKNNSNQDQTLPQATAWSHLHKVIYQFSKVFCPEHWHFSLKNVRSHCNAQAPHISSTKNISTSGLKVIKKISCSTRLSMELFLLMNVKMPTKCWHFNIMSRENSIIGLSEHEK